MQYQSIEKMIRRYVLGDASDDEGQEIEQRIMSDEDFAEQVTFLEELLIEEYVNGSLSPDERKKFEQHFLSTPEGVEQVRLVAVLKEYASHSVSTPAQAIAVDSKRITPRWAFWESLSSRVAFPKYILVFGTLVVALIGIGLAISLLRLQNQLGSLRAQQNSMNQERLQEELSEQMTRNQQLVAQLTETRSRLTALEQELQAAKNSKGLPSPQNNVLAITLLPGRLRDAQTTSPLILHKTQKEIQFLLRLRSDNYPGYKVSLQTEAGEELLSKGNLKSLRRGDHKEIQVNLPASLFSDGNYVLKLQGAISESNYEEMANYYFRIVTK